MTLEEVAGVTKVSVRNLRALEQEKFDQMPGGIFNRGFVRAYAKHLGLDDDQVVADYMEAAGESIPTLDSPDMPGTSRIPDKATQRAAPASVRGPVPSPVPASVTPSLKDQPEASSAQVPWAALIALVVLGTVVLGYWSYHSHRKAADGVPGTEPGTTSRFADSPQSTPSPASPSPAEPSAAAPASADPGSVSSAPSQPAAGSATTPGGQSPLSSSGSGFDVALRAHDEVWLSSAVDGKPPSESIMEDGQSIVVHASDRAILKVGNAAALDVAFNGQKVPVRAVEGEVRTLTFTASGLQAPPAVAPKPN